MKRIYFLMILIVFGIVGYNHTFAQKKVMFYNEKGNIYQTENIRVDTVLLFDEKMGHISDTIFSFSYNNVAMFFTVKKSKNNTIPSFIRENIVYYSSLSFEDESKVSGVQSQLNILLFALCLFVIIIIIATTIFYKKTKQTILLLQKENKRVVKEKDEIEREVEGNLDIIKNKYELKFNQVCDSQIQSGVNKYFAKIDLKEEILSRAESFLKDLNINSLNNLKGEITKQEEGTILIGDLGLQMRTINCLTNVGIKTIEDLRAYRISNFRKSQGVGPKTIKDILQCLKENKISI